MCCLVHLLTSLLLLVFQWIFYKLPNYPWKKVTTGGIHESWKITPLIGLQKLLKRRSRCYLVFTKSCMQTFCAICSANCKFVGFVWCRYFFCCLIYIFCFLIFLLLYNVVVICDERITSFLCCLCLRAPTLGGNSRIAAINKQYIIH